MEWKYNSESDSYDIEHQKSFSFDSCLDALGNHHCKSEALFRFHEVSKCHGKLYK